MNEQTKSRTRHTNTEHKLMVASSRGGCLDKMGEGQREIHRPPIMESVSHRNKEYSQYCCHRNEEYSQQYCNNHVTEQTVAGGKSNH